MNWLRRNSEVLEAIGSIMTVFVALAALIAVKWQIDAADQTQREQSARDIYREHLSLGMQYPQIVLQDYCDLESEKDRLAYSAYVEHFLYTAEQLVVLGSDWKETIREALGEQASYICSRKVWTDYPAEIMTLITSVQAAKCTAVVVCAVDE
jgi:hypothetical protein